MKIILYEYVAGVDLLNSFNCDTFTLSAHGMITVPEPEIG